LEGRPFKLFTDHKPLVAAIARVSLPLSARQQRQLSFLAEFQAELCYTPGEENVVADVLSRPPSVCSIQHLDVGPVNIEEMASLQSTGPDLEKLRALPSLQVQSLQVGASQLWGDCSTGVFWPVVPVQMRRRVFNVLHVVSHPGVLATRKIVASRFLWPGLAADVNTWARECVTCQASKITKHVHLKPEHIHVPERRFMHVHIDIVGPFPQSDGFTHILTMIDRSSRWLEAVPLKSTSTAECARALFDTWVARFGVPSVLTSVRGPQFTSAVWALLCEKLQIQHMTTTAYHLQSNGMLERVHRSLKAALRVVQAAEPSTRSARGPQLLARVRLCTYNSVYSSVQFSPP
jgi:transposase InsO family protein